MTLPPKPISRRQRIPRATYRLQFNREFTFKDATKLVHYLSRLGISHCYASPYLKARPGSTHGYDIIDHNALNPEIGTPEDYASFVAALRRRGMNQILDIVPNHMGVMGSDNVWWLDVLENGQASAYASYFDIDWTPLKDELQGKVLLPTLGGHYGAVLEQGELKLVFDAVCGEFSVWYFQHRFPIDPKEYSRIIGQSPDTLTDSATTLPELQSLLTALGHLPARNEPSPERLAERRRDKDIHKRTLAALCARDAELVRFIDARITEINGQIGAPESFDALHKLLEAQAFRLAYWRVAADEINYRRFFDINELAGLRMENPEVFAATHRYVLALLADGSIDGLRLDHPDGLYDPASYFHTLAEACRTGGPCGYIVVEKILAGHERLPEHWPVHGTTGYDFANLVNGLFVDPAAHSALDRSYESFVREKIDFDELVYRSKRLIMQVAMSSELNVLANHLSRIAETDRHTSDFTLNNLRGALREIVAYFPVYRSYITADQVAPEDRRYIDWAVTVAKKRSQAADITIFDFVRDVLLLHRAADKNDDYRMRVIDFALKFQQYTGPVMAKGLEDTSFYTYNRLISLNDVGGDPRRFGVSVAGFHHANLERAKYWPQALLSTSTHDSKRSEDVRARIDVLSEIPDAWQTQVRRWGRLTRGKKQLVDKHWAPSRNDTYLLFQTLLGAWPLEDLDEAGLARFRERIDAYMLKAVREAKVHSSWLNPNLDYEQAVSAFVAALLSDPAKNLFITDFLPFQKRVARLGLFNSLAQTLLKLTAPGVPDIYQGNEVWEFSLVDPDCRRPVDYAHRQTLLKQVIKLGAARGDKLARAARGLLDSLDDGRVKLYLIWKTLALRKDNDRLFRIGDYLPLRVEGRRADHLCAFARRRRQHTVIVIVPRLFASLTEEEARLPLGDAVWADTWIEAPPATPSTRWMNIFTEESVETRERQDGAYLCAADLFQNFPCAVLKRVADK